MKPLELTGRFPDRYLKGKREKSGLACKRCGGINATIGTIVTNVGTVRRAAMGRSDGRHRHAQRQVPAYALVLGHPSSRLHKEHVPSKRDATPPGRKCCQPIWEIAYKSRNAMGKRSWHALIGGVGIGEGFFSAGVSGDKKDEKFQRGSGSQSKAKVLAMVGGEDIENPKDPGKSAT